MKRLNLAAWLPAFLGALLLPRVDRWITGYFKLPEYAFFVTVISIAVLVGAFFLYRSDRLERHKKETGES
jgi:hypothetical protein